MSSREIADLLGKRHGDVIRDIRSMFEQLGDDANLRHVSEVKDSRGYTAEFLLDRYNTEILVTGYDVKRRASVINRWIELETKSSSPSLPDFSNPVEAARAWADAKESEMKAIAEAQAAKPAVEFVDRYVKAGNSKSLRETAKILRIPEKQFIQQLIDDKLLYRQSGNLLPHQKHHNAGRFTVKTGEANGHAFTQTRVTSDGIDYLANSYGYMIGSAA